VLRRIDRRSISSPISIFIPLTISPMPTLDAEGHIWCADVAGQRCVRIASGGAILDEIRLPEGLKPFACMLGGESGRTDSPFSPTCRAKPIALWTWMTSRTRLLSVRVPQSEAMHAPARLVAAFS
jgi:hypothetical protein